MDIEFKIKMLGEMMPKKYDFSIYFYKTSFEYYIYRNRKCYYQGSAEKITDVLNEIEYYFNKLNEYENNNSNRKASI